MLENLFTVFCRGSLGSITFTLSNSKHLETSGAADGVGTCTEVFVASQFIQRTHLQPSFDFLAEVLRLFTSSLPSSSWCHLLFEVLPVLHEWMAFISLKLPSFSSIIILLPVTRVRCLSAGAAGAAVVWWFWCRGLSPSQQICTFFLLQVQGSLLFSWDWIAVFVLKCLLPERFDGVVSSNKCCILLLVQMNEEPSCMDQTGGRPHRCFTQFHSLRWCETKRHWVWE